MLKYMYLAYLDDSGPSTDKRYQVVGGILLKDSHFTELEQILGYVVESHVPEEFQDTFEFHSAELWHQRGPFQALPREKAVDIMQAFAQMVAAYDIPVVYGAVDLDRHRESIWGSASPLAIGFKICLDAVEDWFCAQQPDDFAVAVFDNINKPELRKNIVNSFRDNRRIVREVSGSRGRWKHFHDDLYFGESAFSAGLQAADLCAYLANRHLHARLDTEKYFEMIQPNILCGKVVPE
jgi:hypothetical protein